MMNTGLTHEKELILSRKFLIGEVLARNSRKYPDKTALIYGQKMYTYSELNDRVNKLANALLKFNVSRQDRVASLFYNCNEALEGYLATVKVGALAVPLNYRLNKQEIIYIVNHCEPSVLIIGEEFVDLIISVKSQLNTVKYIICAGAKRDEIINYDQVLSENYSNEPLQLLDDDEGAFIVYTSGTTGKPKGAVLTHKNVLSNCINMVIETGVINEDIYVLFPPLFHVGGFSTIMHHLYVGATNIIMKSFDPKELFEVIQRERVTRVWCVPTMWNMVINHPDVGKYDLSTVRACFSAGSILPTEVKNGIIQWFPNTWIIDVFGQTEMSPVTTILKSRDDLSKIASVGRPMINVEVKIVNENAIEAEIGEVGEVVYRGPTVMKEYYRDPEATANALRNGWFHSGDLLRRDGEGYLYVVDRKDDMIISGGENIYPAEIEEILYSQPNIFEAAVIGVPDEKWGQSVLAVVVPKPGKEIIGSDVIEYCSNRLARYKSPRRVVVIESLPKNAAGKVLKNELRKEYGNPFKY